MLRMRFVETRRMLRMFAATALLCGWATPSATADELVLVEEGQSLAPIVIFGDAPPFTRQAADELAQYIEKVSGARPEIIEGVPDPLPERAIWVGYQVRYTPEALIWHRDRRDQAALRAMLYGYSVGVYALLCRALFVHRDADAIGVGLSWVWKHHLRQTMRGIL